MNKMDKREKETALLPCPFCGETRIKYEVTITERAIRCTRCSAKIVRDISTVLPEHVWNTRPADALQERVKALRDLPFLVNALIIYIEQLPQDVFGSDGDKGGSWAIRDEFLHGLKKAQVALNEQGEQDGR